MIFYNWTAKFIIQTEKTLVTISTAKIFNLITLFLFYNNQHKNWPNAENRKILLLNQLNIEENIYNDRIKKCKVVIENKSLPSQGRD